VDLETCCNLLASQNERL